jgi:DNA primase
MARIKDTSVEAVKAGADFVEVVSGRTQLRKVGGRYTGRCPFHDERTPSFSVNAVDKLYYCFGCGAKGDLITFVRETEGLDFAGSIEWLGERFRIPIEYEESSPEQDAARTRRARLLALLDQAATFYERTLWDSEAGGMARDYLKGRGLNEEVSREFRLGLALGGYSLARKALAKGFSQEELRAAGLTRQRGDDFFQRRLLFPLADRQGRIIGFQARKLHEDDPLKAKYVNTPESELFHKGGVVYGLDKARAAIAREDRAIVVEGNTDVIALRQAKLEPVVASMGTALTEQQLKELGRLTKRLWLAFDGDAAGETATLRGMELAANLGFDVKVVALKPGVDPADDPAGFESSLGKAEPYLLYRVRVEIEREDDRAVAYRNVKALLDAAPESNERQDAWKLATDRLKTAMQLRHGSSQRTGARAVSQTRLLDASAKLERNALAGALAHDELKPLLHELTPEHFYDLQHRQLRAHIVEGAPLDEASLGLLAELDAHAAAEGIDQATGEELIWRLREREMRRELRDADPARAKELQESLQKLLERVAALSSI